MYTWALDLYIWVIKVIFVSLPFFVFFISKEKIKAFKKYQIIMISFLLFVVLTVVLLWIREYHINTIFKICFDYTGYEYKDGILPEGCYAFKADKYMGAGWPITAIFLIVYNFIYHFILYFIWIFFHYFKYRKIKK